MGCTLIGWWGKQWYFFGVNSKQKKKTDHWKALEKVRGGEEREAPKWVDIACVNCFYVVAGK